MNAFIARSLPKWMFGLVLASGVATGALAASAQPAEAGVVVSIGFGGGYAPGYHWYRWHDGYGWHRRWVPLGWAPPPVALYPAPVYAVPAAYGRPYADPYYYGRSAYGRPIYGRPVHDFPVWRDGRPHAYDGAPHYAGWHDDRPGFHR